MNEVTPSEAPDTQNRASARRGRVSVMPHQVVALLCALSVVACSSLRTVVDRGSPQPTDRSAIGTSVRPGDSIVITGPDGQQRALLVTAISADMIEGQSAGSEPLIRVPLDEVVRIERNDVDRAKTALLVFAIALGIYLVVYAAASAAGATLASGL